MDFSSFLTSLLTSFMIFLVLVILYGILSKRGGNDVVYYPNKILKYSDSFHSKKKKSKNPFSWVREAVAASENEAIEMGGVDSAVYLLFLSTALAILLLSGILLVPVLLPVARTDNNIDLLLDSPKNNVSYSDMDKLAMANIQPKSTRLWAFLIGTYWVTIIAYTLLWRAYKHVSNLRASAMSSPVVKPEYFAVLVRDIPPISKGESRKEQVDAYFRAVHPEVFYKSMIVTDNKKVTKIFEELEGYKKKLAHAEAVYEQSKTQGKPEGTRPTNRTGFLGLVGSKVDTIDYCNEQMSQLVPQLEEEQKCTSEEKQAAAAIVFFTNRPAAVLASQTIHAQMMDRWTVLEAPEPRQLLWSNLPKNTYERQIRQCVVYGIVFLTVVFYMIPIGFVSAFTTLSNLEKLLTFLKPVLRQQAVKSILEAYLPQIALIVFLALLPKFLMFLSTMEGIPSQSHVVRAAAGKYFYFVIFNVFLGVTIGGTLFRSLKTILKQPGEIVSLLGTNLPLSSTFFLTFVALKFFVGYGLELSRIVPLIIFHLKRKYMCKTEDELKEAWAPGDLGYATRFPNDMLILTIVLCYSIISPLIIPFGVLYFGLGWIVCRNQVLNVYVPSYESNGRMWPHMYKRIMAALVIYQITMLGYFGIKKFYYTLLLIPLPVMSIIFTYICHKRFYPAFYNTPLEVAQRDAKLPPNLEVIYREFIPPCLRPQKATDDGEVMVSGNLNDSEHFEDARSQVSRSSSLV